MEELIVIVKVAPLYVLCTIIIPVFIGCTEITGSWYQWNYFAENFLRNATITSILTLQSLLQRNIGNRSYNDMLCFTIQIFISIDQELNIILVIYKKHISNQDVYCMSLSSFFSMLQIFKFQVFVMIWIVFAEFCFTGFESYQ